eukprot:jgi/Chlat1/9269/Chrsp99S08532
MGIAPLATALAHQSRGFGLRGEALRRSYRLVSAACGVHTGAAGAENDSAEVLVRGFIHDALYHPQKGFFTANSGVVGRLPQPIDFKSLSGEAEYRRTLASIYKQLRPWYASAIADYILQKHSKLSAPLKIYEIGGGNGTCAVNILHHLQQHASPEVFNSLSYTSVEISAQLAALQKSRVHAHEGFRGKYSVVQGSASDPSTWGSQDASPCFIILLEVLDNLPHDRVVFKRLQQEQASQPFQTSVIMDQTINQLREVLRPVTDRLITRCLAAEVELRKDDAKSVWMWLRMIGNVGSGEDIAWMPTACLALVDTLHAMRPSHALIAADFNSLPEAIVPGRRAPLVDGVNQDHSTYLVPQGSADIFFPTNFKLLQRLDCAAATQSGQTGVTPDTTTALTTAEFMKKHADVGQTRTRRGYNPLLEDFTNTRLDLEPVKSLQTICICSSAYLHTFNEWNNLLFNSCSMT